MPTAYVYSPFTGDISQGPGCNGNHSFCGSGSSPVDVAGLGTINLYVNYPTVKYVSIQIGSLCCQGVAGADADQRRTVKIDLFDANSCKFGTVLYGHVRQVMVGNGWRTLTSGTLPIGQTVSTYNAMCYRGIHVHMQRIGGTTNVSCGADVNQGSSIIYYWGISVC
jgi:hypothetical protein